MINKKGFTLIELLLVIAIISVISLIGLTTYFNIQKNARDAKRRTDLNAIGQALEVHNNHLPNQFCPAPAGSYCKPKPDWFLGTIPVDPNGSDYPGVSSINDGDTSFTISVNLESGLTLSRSNQQ